MMSVPGANVLAASCCCRTVSNWRMRRHFSEAVKPAMLAIDRAISRDHNVSELTVRNVGFLDLQLVDEIVDLVGQIDAVPGHHQF